MDGCTLISTATSQATIDEVRASIAIHGIPDWIVSDSSCFTCAEFELFCMANGIIHTKTALYHTASNGLAERGAQTFKEGVKKMKRGTLEERLQSS